MDEEKPWRDRWWAGHAECCHEDPCDCHMAYIVALEQERKAEVEDGWQKLRAVIADNVRLREAIREIEAIADAQFDKVNGNPWGAIKRIRDKARALTEGKNDG